jgi:hypothetical protein
MAQISAGMVYLQKIFGREGGFEMKRSLLFFLSGVLWLFVYSIPVGSGKILFEVSSEYVVRSAPSLWLQSRLNRVVDYSLNEAVLWKNSRASNSGAPEMDTNESLSQTASDVNLQ